VVLIVAEFLLIPLRTQRLVPAWTGTLRPYGWWATGLLLLWVAVPTLILRRSGPLPFSIALPKTARGVAVYGALIAIMVPALLIVSRQPAFLATYPMFRPAPPLVWSGGLLLLYWLCYGSILFSTEFLFRGVLLFGLESRLGTAAIGVSVLPYCLIHVHKPLAEALGSIVAGFVLGYLALRTRSIGGGVVVHCTVAFGMDALALARGGWF
jgi:membrane protease YdiL (CAAX protease family)